MVGGWSLERGCLEKEENDGGGKDSSSKRKAVLSLKRKGPSGREKGLTDQGVTLSQVPTSTGRESKAPPFVALYRTSGEKRKYLLEKKKGAFFRKRIFFKDRECPERKEEGGRNYCSGKRESPPVVGKIV